MLIDLVTRSFQFWVSTNWLVAFLMSLAVNLFTYFSVAYFLYFITSYLTKRGAGEFLDQRPLYEGQIWNEIKYSIGACILFSIASLITRYLYSSVWPESVLSLVIQLLAFTAFYETYSYFIHRLLHLNDISLSSLYPSQIGAYNSLECLLCAPGRSSFYWF